MPIPTNTHGFVSRLKALLSFQRFRHSMGKEEFTAHLNFNTDGSVDTSKWRQVNSNKFGIKKSMIPEPSWIVLKKLQNKGFEAYLVGGCVRDLLLHRIPKDFDVITTATLKEIKKQFYRAQIVGRRFPICMVHLKGSVVEVSSFETVVAHAEEKEEVNSCQMPSDCDEKDILRWRNCLKRDFTINSLFFDPSVNKIYDYANGMMDLKSLKLQTLIPAQYSFKEDCARILRGLRIAARLGLSFSKDTETAIRDLSSSIMSLSKSRIMLELNYMLSYGAAESSLYLLWRFNLLQLLLPFQAAYLAQQFSQKTARGSMMLMKLFSSLDKLLTCDRPSDCSLWVALLAFHLALINNPQDALVIWTFSSVLYFGKWDEGVKFAREHAQTYVKLIPEVSEACVSKSSNILAKEVVHLASLVQDSITVLTETDCLQNSMSRYPTTPSSGLVFIPKKIEKHVVELFGVLANDIECFEEGRESLDINYDLLGSGNLRETRHVLGKVIMDTMRSGIVEEKMGMPKNQPSQWNTVGSEGQANSSRLNQSNLNRIAVRIENRTTVLLKQEGVTRQKSVKKGYQSELDKAKKRSETAGNSDLQVVVAQKHVVPGYLKRQEMDAKHQNVANRENDIETYLVAEACSTTQETKVEKHKDAEKRKCNIAQDLTMKKQKLIIAPSGLKIEQENESKRNYNSLKLEGDKENNKRRNMNHSRPRLSFFFK